MSCVYTINVNKERPMTLQQWRWSLLLFSSIYLKKKRTSRVAVYTTLLITRASGNAAPRPLVSGTDRNQLFNDRSADPLLAAADKAHCTSTRRALGSALLSLTKRAAVPHGRGFWPRSPRARQKRRVQSNLVLITRVKAIPPTRRDALSRNARVSGVTSAGLFEIKWKISVSDWWV